MAQTLLFANIAELSALSVLTILSSRFSVVSVPFKVIVLKTSQLTCHSFTGDLYIRAPCQAMKMLLGYGSVMGGEVSAPLLFSKLLCLFNYRSDFQNSNGAP